MAETKVATNDKGGKGFDEYQVHCKLMALGLLLGNLHRLDCVITENLCFGVELFLTDIAHEIDPTQRKDTA
jgi:hypothetical protein